MRKKIYDVLQTDYRLGVLQEKCDKLGDFVEIEYQDSNDSVKEVKEFINLIKIQGNEQDMYGAIVKERLKEDEKFREVFYNELEKILKNYWYKEKIYI